MGRQWRGIDGPRNGCGSAVECVWVARCPDDAAQQKGAERPVTRLVGRTRRHEPALDQPGGQAGLRQPSGTYGYDGLGQVISGKHFSNGGTSVPGQQFEYGLDDIGNRREPDHGNTAC